MKNFIIRHSKGKEIIVNKYTAQDKQWLKKIIEPLNNNFSEESLKRHMIFSKWKKRFGREPTHSALMCLIGRIKNPNRDKIYRKQKITGIDNKKSKQFIFKRPGEYEWCIKILTTKLQGKKRTVRTIKENNLVEDYKKEFHREISVDSLYQKFRKTLKNEYGKTIGREEKIDKRAEKKLEEQANKEILLKAIKSHFTLVRIASDSDHSEQGFCIDGFNTREEINKFINAGHHSILDSEYYIKENITTRPTKISII